MAGACLHGIREQQLVELLFKFRATEENCINDKVRKTMVSGGQGWGKPPRTFRNGSMENRVWVEMIGSTASPYRRALLSGL